MPTLARSGHGTLIAVEFDPESQPGVFVTVAELNGDITWPTLTRPKTVVTGHQHTIDYSVRGVMSRDDFSWSVNWVYNNATHNFTAGLGALMVSGVEFGVRLRGPGGTTNTDEWIMSGGLTSLSRSSPVRENVQTSNLVFAPSGPMKIDGTVIGVDIS